MPIFILRFPFNWKNPIGYLAAFSVQYFGLLIVAGIGVYFLVFLSGSCWLMISMAHDLKYDLNAIAGVAKSRSKMNNEFSKFVEFHSDIKQLSENFN